MFTFEKQDEEKINKICNRVYGSNYHSRVGIPKLRLLVEGMKADPKLFTIEEIDYANRLLEEMN